MNRFYNFLLKLSLLSLIFVLCANVSFAAIYYVSSSGNDANSGLSSSLPWKSIAKVNGRTFSPGDQILFKRGDTWEGTITPTSSGASGNPIVYGSYGTGDNPKIYGSTVITGWTLHSGNIYKASVTSPVAQLFINGTRMKLARTPNAGYLNITSVQSSTQFTSTGLKSGINYVGATWVGRTTAYTIYSRIVTASNSQTLTINSSVFDNLTVGEGFFICDKLEFLDSAGEWYYDKNTGVIYFWTPTGDTPSNYIVRGSVREYGVNIASRSYVTIQDFDILHSSITGIYLNNADYVNIDNNKIISPDLYGIYGPSSGNTTSKITGNYIYQANDNGLKIYSPSSIITDNKVEDTGLFANINKTQSNHSDNAGTGIFTRGNDIEVKYNHVINSGYCGINFGGINHKIHHNYVNNSCLTLADGGGIYTYVSGTNNTLPGSAGSHITDNIVLNTIGNVAGYTKRSDVHAIYLDGGSHDILIERNTISYAMGGIFINRLNYGHTIRNNFVMDCGYLLLFMNNSGESTVSNNTIYACNRQVWSVWNQSYQKFIYGEGTFRLKMDYNTYVHHYQLKPFWSINAKNLIEWRAFSSQDAHSTFDNSPLAVGETEKLFYNETKSPKTFTLTGTGYKDIQGNSISSTFTLQPYTSKIVIGTNFNVTLNDSEKPVITSFTIPTTSSSLTVSLSSLSATDNIGVTGYLITESSSTPQATATGWTSTKPTSYVFSTVGSKTLYAWAKDAAGNVSAPMTANTIIPSTSTDVTAPLVTAFTIPATTTSLTVPISTFTANDNIGVVGYLLTTTSTPPTSGSSGWSTTKPTSYVFSTVGSKTLYAWAKDAAGNVSAPRTASTIISTPTASAFTFTGPTSGNVNSVSANFTVTPNNPYTGTITITFSGTGSTGLSNKVLTFSNSSTPQSFTITPTVAGSIILTPTNNGTLSNPNSLTYTVNGSVPYMGYNVKGTTLHSIRAGDINALQFTAGSNFTATTMYISIAPFNGKIKGAIYSDNGGKPGTKLGETIELTNPTMAGFQKLTGLNVSIIQGKKYWLALWSNATYKIDCETTGGIMKYKSFGTYGAWPYNLILDKSYVLKYSMYITGGLKSAGLDNIATEIMNNDEPLESFKIDLYPNPSSSKFWVRFSSLPEAGSTIDILNMSGKKVASRVITGMSEEFNLDDQPAGLYLVKTTVGSKEKINKLMLK